MTVISMSRTEIDRMSVLQDLAASRIKVLGRIGSVGHRTTGRYPGAVNRHHGIGWEFVHVCIDDRRRFLLSVEDVPGRLHAPRSAPNLHQTLHTEDQRHCRLRIPDFS